MEATPTIPPYHAAGMPVAACCPTRSTTVTDPVPLIWWVLYNELIPPPPPPPRPPSKGNLDWDMVVGGMMRVHMYQHVLCTCSRGSRFFYRDLER